jgi:osmotically inducible lipoprotein OsmB
MMIGMGIPMAQSRTGRIQFSSNSRNTNTPICLIVPMRVLMRVDIGAERVRELPATLLAVYKSAGFGEERSMRFAVAVSMMAALLLAACGTTPGERATTGAGIGAAGGAVAGALLGAPLLGAALGAAGGATVGAVTDPNDVYLGKPIWK